MSTQKNMTVRTLKHDCMYTKTWLQQRCNKRHLYYSGKNKNEKSANNYQRLKRHKWIRTSPRITRGQLQVTEENLWLRTQNSKASFTCKQTTQWCTTHNKKKTMVIWRNQQQKVISLTLFLSATNNQLATKSYTLTLFLELTIYTFVWNKACVTAIAGSFFCWYKLCLG